MENGFFKPTHPTKVWKIQYFFQDKLFFLYGRVCRVPPILALPFLKDVYQREFWPQCVVDACSLNLMKIFYFFFILNGK